LSKKEMRARRQSGAAPPKRKSPNTGSSQSSAIVISEDDAKTERKVQKFVKSRNKISLKCGCQFKVYVHSLKMKLGK